MPEDTLSAVPDWIVDVVVSHALANPEMSMTLVVSLLGAVFHYWRTGKLPLGRLPWQHIRQMARELGDKYFGKSRPRGVPGLVAKAPPSRVADALRQRHHESVDLYSYEHRKEAYGLRRPSGFRRHPDSGEWVPMEVHPRLFRTGDNNTLILSHHEASRFEAQGDHLNGVMLSWERGRDITGEDLKADGIEFEEVESERDADIKVVDPK